MNFIKQIDRINKAHKLIQTEKTGNPDAFARQMLMGRSQLYNLIALLKSMGAPVKYSKQKECFYYSAPFVLELSYTLKVGVGE